MTPWGVPARPLCPWNSPGKNTGVDGHALLQGMFPTQESIGSSAVWAVSLLSDPPGKPRQVKQGLNEIHAKLRTSNINV